MICREPPTTKTDTMLLGPLCVLEATLKDGEQDGQKCSEPHDDDPKCPEQHDLGYVPISLDSPVHPLVLQVTQIPFHPNTQIPFPPLIQCFPVSISQS